MTTIINALRKLRLSIRNKIGLAFGLVLVGFIVNGLVSVFLLFNIKAAQEHQSQVALHQAQLQYYQLAFNSEVDTHSDALFLVNSRYFEDNFRADLIARMLKFDSHDPDLANHDFERQLFNLYTTASSDLDDLETYIKKGNFAEGQVVWNNYKPDFDRITKLLSNRKQALVVEATQANKDINDTVFLSVSVISIVAFGSILLTLLVLYLVEWVMIKPINSLQSAWASVAGGQLDQRLAITNRDEIGTLALSFEQAVSNLQQVLRGVQIGERLHSVSGELSTICQQQADGLNEQVSSISQIMAAIEEMGSTAGMIAGNATHVADLTNTTLQQIAEVSSASSDSQECATEMVKVVQTTLQSLEQVGNRVDEFSRSMTELNEQAMMINRVVELLGSLAKDVHLLSLNASIESASAGEHGERFKEVARHIKGLAARANQMTSETRTLITKVCQSSRTTLSEVEEGRAEISQILQANAGLYSNLEKLEVSTNQVISVVHHLTGLAEQVDNQAIQIKLATQQQHLSSDQLSISARSVSNVAEATAEATRLVVNNSLHLENLTNQLNLVLGRVQLPTI